MNQDTFKPRLFFYWQPTFGSSVVRHDPPPPPKIKTPEDEEIDKIEKQIGNLRDLQRLIREEREVATKLKDAENSIEPLKNRLEKIRESISKLRSQNPQL